uniref:Uncharacterized protein LOC111127736 n=1 Tax=Crassostrea virginica TaxID=6565 RepID=A0A8B8DLP4_CRAVI|nr:uncharacterized protein LOC111127736 [Crassostrea virginica]
MAVLTFLLLSFIACGSEATLCYQCSDAKSNGDCARDIDGLLEDRQRYFQETNITTAHFSSKFTFLKNCSGLWGEYCLFEHIREAGSGKLMSFVRGCTSIPGIPDNQTFCKFQSENKIIVCSATCGEDFCNGPQPAGSAKCLLSYVLALMMFTLHFSL